jgi:hypothetical protein
MLTHLTKNKIIGLTHQQAAYFERLFACRKRAHAAYPD